MQIGSLFARAELEVMLTCRVKYWKHSAVAHLVPSFRVRRHQDAAIRAAARHLVRHSHCGASVRRPRMIEAVPSRWNGLNSCAKQSCSGKLGRREYSWQLESPFRLSIWTARHFGGKRLDELPEASLTPEEFSPCASRRTQLKSSWTSSARPFQYPEPRPKPLAAWPAMRRKPSRCASSAVVRSSY